MEDLNKEIEKEIIEKKEKEVMKDLQRNTKVTALEFTFEGDIMNQTGNT